MLHIGRSLRTTTHKLSAAACVATIALGGCGSSSVRNSASTGGQGHLTTLKIATVPFVASAPLYMGIKHGFFAAEGLRLEPQLLATGPLITTAVLSGQDPIGFSSTVPLIIASSRGLPVQMIAPGELAANGSAVLVSKNSPIRMPNQLAGKTVGVLAINDIGDITIRYSLARLGVDVSKIKLVVVPLPDMDTALHQGRVDAIWTVEPFTTLAKAHGDRVIVYNYTGTRPDLTVAAYFSTKQFIDSHPEIVKAFDRAMNRSLAYAETHPREARAIIPTFSQISPSLASQVTLSTWKPDLNRPALQQEIDLSQKYGLITKKPSLETLIAHGS